jgi:hypothetical protein
MTIDCAACGITHASCAERDAIHGAVARVRRWFRQYVTMALEPVAKPKLKKRASLVEIPPKVQPSVKRRA